jgi:hypothetical protein
MKNLLILLLVVALSACGGGGGSSPTATQATQPVAPATPVAPASPVAPATPIAVQASSYLNKMAAAAALGPQTLPAEVTQSNTVAFGDFFQDGTYSMVTASCGDTACGANGQNGVIHFYKSVSGQWVDHTTDILSNAGGCLHPRKAIVADFNGSGKPGVFIACTGPDSGPNYPGEQSHLLLPQSNGQYTNTTLPFTGYFHSASAADFNGNGYADIVVVDPNVHKAPYFLVNNKDGTFTADYTTRLPAVQLSNCTAANCFPEIVTTELIDFSGSGKYDLFLAGQAPTGAAGDVGNWSPTIFKNQGDNTYSQANAANTVLPLADAADYQLTLDIVSVNGTIYLTNAHANAPGSMPLYGNSDIEKSGQEIWNNQGQTFPNGMTWVNWIIPFQGKIDSMNSTYGVSVAE